MEYEHIVPEKQFGVANVLVKVYETRKLMGMAAAREVAERIRDVLAQKESISMVFAAAPSQNEFLAALRSAPGLDWSRVSAFHLDEYIGLPSESPQSFGRFLKDSLFDWVRPGKVYFLNGDANDPHGECTRYAQLLMDNPIDIACIGIGENGHIAFNDPHVADFQDPRSLKVVELDQRCRVQQVHDGCFSALEKVPSHALTMTIPAIMAAECIYCIVPGPTKQEAVKRTLEGPITTACPASVLRTHPCAVLFLDRQAASTLESVRVDGVDGVDGKDE